MKCSASDFFLISPSRSVWALQLSSEKDDVHTFWRKFPGCAQCWRAFLDCAHFSWCCWESSRDSSRDVALVVIFVKMTYSNQCTIFCDSAFFQEPSVVTVLRQSFRSRESDILPPTPQPWSAHSSAVQNCKNSLHEYLFEYERSSPAARLEWRTSRVPRPNQKGEYNSFRPGTAQFTTEETICANVFSNTSSRVHKVYA